MTALTALLPLALVAVMYRRRTRTLARRGTPVELWRQASFALGLLIAATAQLLPYEDELFFVHMLQHVLLGDLAPLALVLGLTGPILRPVLAVEPLGKLRVLVHPLVALPLWAVSLYVWHLPRLYEAAVEHELVHALEHLSFFGTGVLMWAAVVEVLPGPEWFGTGAKFGYVAVVRLLETVLGNVFVWSNDVIYGVYDHGEEHLGLGALQDQGLAGTIMMVEGSLVTIGALAWLFLKLAREGELRQRLLEEGLDPRTVRRAVRYGRGEELESAR
ncbi:MAG TPA: cytochrome c oxidase assembly protein [Gaiellaceae bacterium]|jgi:putative membrane protein|nr:cytochrome c oxidase assembly protein [Gaiellaceae bacterium]